MNGNAEKWHEHWLLVIGHCRGERKYYTQPFIEEMSVEKVNYVLLVKVTNIEV